MDGLIRWFYSGLGGLGGWVVTLAAALVALTWVLTNSARRHLPARGWRLTMTLATALVLPAVVFRLLTAAPPAGSSPAVAAVFGLGGLGSAASIATAAAYAVRFRGLVGCDKGHKPYPRKHKMCPVCARQTTPGVPGYRLAIASPLTTEPEGEEGPTPRSSRRTASAWLATGKGFAYQIYAGDTVIGRDAGCDVRLYDMAVSRIHAKIVEDGGKFTLIDLGSTGGTFLNNRQVRRPETLGNGDVITMGNGTRLEFTTNHAHPDLKGTKPPPPSRRSR
jgi:hypothetical protein